MSTELALPDIEATRRLKYRMCRSGIFYWKLQKAKGIDALPNMSPAEKQRLVNQLCRALEEDARVVSVETPTIEPDYSSRMTIYPDWQRTTPDAILTGVDAFQIFNISHPITFRMHVPIKNQPPLYGNEDIPTEDYFVSWDGVTAFVLWEQDDAHVPLSGGQVVSDILSTALATMHDELYIQACTPDCKNQFFHTVMIIDFQSDVENWDAIRLRPLGSGRVGLSVSADMDNEQILKWIDLYLSLDSERFAETKNLTRRVMDIESSIRDQLAHLLGHYHEHASLAAQPLWRNLLKRMRMLGWRREARQILASLWLSLANVEGKHSAWSRCVVSYRGA